MARITKNIFKEGRKTFRFAEIVSSERKKVIEKHPHSKEFFRFKKSCRGWKWFKSISPYQNDTKVYNIVNNKVDKKLDDIVLRKTQ